MTSRERLLTILLGITGIVAAGAIALAANAISGDSIGLSAQPVSLASSSLGPKPAPAKRERGDDHGSHSDRRGHHDDRRGPRRLELRPGLVESGFVRFLRLLRRRVGREPPSRRLGHQRAQRHLGHQRLRHERIRAGRHDDHLRRSRRGRRWGGGKDGSDDGLGRRRTGPELARIPRGRGLGASGRRAAGAAGAANAPGPESGTPRSGSRPRRSAASSVKAVWMPSMKPLPLWARSLAPMKTVVVRPRPTEPPAIWNM